MVIDEMYFRIDEMRSVDVVRQERPLLLFLVLVGAIFGIEGAARTNARMPCASDKPRA